MSIPEAPPQIRPTDPHPISPASSHGQAFCSWAEGCTAWAQTVCDALSRHGAQAPKAGHCRLGDFRDATRNNSGNIIFLTTSSQSTPTRNIAVSDEVFLQLYGFVFWSLSPSVCPKVRGFRKLVNISDWGDKSLKMSDTFLKEFS